MRLRCRIRPLRDNKRRRCAAPGPAPRRPPALGGPGRRARCPGPRTSADHQAHPARILRRRRCLKVEGSPVRLLRQDASVLASVKATLQAASGWPRRWLRSGLLGSGRNESGTGRPALW